MQPKEIDLLMIAMDDIPALRNLFSTKDSFRITHRTEKPRFDSSIE